MKNNITSPSGIILLAKQSGKTSFASLNSIKKSLSTSKVGHTGTLDSFADGLLVVLSNRLTHLVGVITDFDKEYLALVEFASETDTLDPTGTVIKTGEIPSQKQLIDVLDKFTGEIMQEPPAYSALHIDGKRSSDLVRQGVKVELQKRKITVHSIELVDFKDKYALLKIHCSKGTYIRSLARDIAYSLGTVAHLKALRRTKVGPFNLEDAVGVKNLIPFEIDQLLNAVPQIVDDDLDEIKNSVKQMDKNIALCCGFEIAVLKGEHCSDFFNGRPLNFKYFDVEKHFDLDCKIAVFTETEDFVGVVEFVQGRLKYNFVVKKD